MNPQDVGVILLSVASVVAGQILLKQGMARVGPIGLGRLRAPVALALCAARTWQVAAGTALYVLALVLWVFALSRVPLSLAYPFLALSYVGVAATAARTLGERLTASQWIGTLLAVTGVCLIASTGS